jgi:ribokinase
VIPELVTVGGLTIDNVIASDGTVALARVGGNSAYSGVGARCWVGMVGLVSLAVATFPRDVLARLEANNLLLDGVAHHPARLRYADWFIYDDAGHRHDRLRSLPGELEEAGFSTDRLTPAEVRRWMDILKARPEPPERSYSQFRHDTPMTTEQVPAHYRNARGVHLAPCRLDVLMTMAGVFKPTGMLMTLDPGWQLASTPLADLAPLLAQVDAFLPSEVELQALVPGAGMADGLAELARHCPGIVAVKCGPKGSLVWDSAKGQPVSIPAMKVEAADPTGAGDAWSGGFLAGLVETGDPLLAACFGTVSASQVVQRFGADGALPVDQTACRASLNRQITTIRANEA